MIIHGLTKTTLLDYPGLVACTVFTGGCNMRCLYCHNSPLVLDPGSNPIIPEEDFFAFLKKRRGIIKGVCVTGGEPTLQSSLQDFLTRIREEESNLKIKLDTNGLRPKVLGELLRSGLLDMIAMDIKSDPEDYPRITGISPDQVDRILESAELIRSLSATDGSGNEICRSVDYEFRTTVSAQLFSPDNFEKIGRWLEGSRAYYIQAFRESPFCLTEGLKEPGREELDTLLAAVKPFIPSAQLRGI